MQNVQIQSHVDSKFWAFYITNHLLNPFSPAYTTFFADLRNPTTRQAIELESCSNPLRIQQVL